MLLPHGPVGVVLLHAPVDCPGFWRDPYSEFVECLNLWPVRHNAAYDPRYASHILNLGMILGMIPGPVRPHVSSSLFIVLGMATARIVGGELG